MPKSLVRGQLKTGLWLEEKEIRLYHQNRAIYGLTYQILRKMPILNRSLVGQREYWFTAGFSRVSLSEVEEYLPCNEKYCWTLASIPHFLSKTKADKTERTY